MQLSHYSPHRVTFMKHKQLSLNGCSEVTPVVGSFCVKLRFSVDSNATFIGKFPWSRFL